MKHFLLSLTALFAGVGGLQAQGELALKSGDRITISIGAIPDSDVAQIKGVYNVQDNGMINLLHIGEIRAAGMKPSTLQRSIEQTYIAREIYTRPSVLVSIDGGSGGEATMRSVTVTGVTKPGIVPYRQNMTLTQAIMTAGGPTPFGNMRKVKLIRAGRAATVHDLRSNAGNPAVDVQVQPDDQILVPE